MQHLGNYKRLFRTHKHQATRRLMLLALRVLSATLITVGAIIGLRYFLNARSAPLEQQIATERNAESPQNTQAVSTPPELQPSLIEIPALKTKAPIVRLGLTQSGELQVPETYSKVGWYKYGPAPGSTGAAVLVGHLDSPDGPSVFWNLKKIQPGEEIRITKNDGSVAVFKVDSLEEYSQDNFPTEKVYDRIPYAGLRLVTCAGTYDHKNHRYAKNLVVYASMDD